MSRLNTKISRSIKIFGSQEEKERLIKLMFDLNKSEEFVFHRKYNSPEDYFQRTTFSFHLKRITESGVAKICFETHHNFYSVKFYVINRAHPFGSRIRFEKFLEISGRDEVFPLFIYHMDLID